MSVAGRRDLTKLLADAQLPALPHSAIQILQASRDPDFGPEALVSPIEADPGLTGQVLRFVNSSYFGFARKISSVRTALTMVGVRPIKNFALWSAVFSLMPNPKCGPFDLRNLWQDSLRRGLAARALAKLLGQRDGEEAFAAALLQDMAVPVLAEQLPDDYCQLLDARRTAGRRLSELEMERFGWHHGHAAAAMSAQWNLPAEFAALIQDHAATGTLLTGECSDPLAAAVRLSALLPATADEAWLEAGLFDEAYQRLRPAGDPSAVELLAKVDLEFSDFAPVLNLPAPAKCLTQLWADAPAGCHS